MRGFLPSSVRPVLRRTGDCMSAAGKRKDSLSPPPSPIKRRPSVPCGASPHARVTPGCPLVTSKTDSRWDAGLPASAATRTPDACRRRSRSLEAISGWTWDPYEDDFRRGLETLMRYARREGHSAVPLSHREGRFSLGPWVHRRRIDHRRGRLRPDRIAALEAVPGWSRSGHASRIQSQEARILEALEVFARREGNSSVPENHREAGVRPGASSPPLARGLESGPTRPGAGPTSRAASRMGIGSATGCFRPRPRRPAPLRRPQGPRTGPR